MFFFFVLGTHEFRSPLKGYEGVTAQCQNCGNWSAHCIKRWPWFTFCWIPILPLSFGPYKEVACPICHFMQDLKHRPDIISSGSGSSQPQHHVQGQGFQGNAPVYK